MFAVVPLQPIASQIVTVQLNQQQARMRVYQAGANVYLDLYVNDALVIGGVVGRHMGLIVRDAYLGFAGDLAFFDTQPDPVLGGTDPQYAGLGGRYVLLYMSPGPQ